MNNLEKMKKEELKTLFIEQLNEIQSLMDWSNEEGVPGIFGSLIVDSQYLHDRNLSDPNEYMHKHYKKDNYLSEVKIYQELLDELKELKKEYENSDLNQINDVPVLEKMKKEELKSLFINHLEKIADLVKWSNENEVSVLVGDLIVESSYVKNLYLRNPYNDMHKHMEKKHYLQEIQEYQKLINKLEDLKDKHEKGHFNQIKKSNLNQTNRENENNNSDQKNEDNVLEKEKSNSIQNKRGGKREGAGRKGFGITKKVSVTLPSEVWREIEELCEKGNLNQSKVLRELIQKGLLNDRD
ncbi:ribbon-helix-helix domain-containing protein [Bacillus paranthracis]|uniref:ribbon-helix-helix domain-containing protein n=1 Tax=Bacillus paranthracis TaxID=2026186 RepID=UPI001F3AFAEC